jgi:hypothetical protein
MKPRVKMRDMPGDVSKQVKIDMLEGKHPDKARSKSYKKLVRLRERATLKRQARREVTDALALFLAPLCSDRLRPHVKLANSQGADIVASGDGRVEWCGGHKATVDECPGGVIVAFDGKSVTVCTEQHLSQVLVVISRELVD